MTARDEPLDAAALALEDVRIPAEALLEAVFSHVGTPALQGLPGSGVASSERPWSGS